MAVRFPHQSTNIIAVFATKCTAGRSSNRQAVRTTLYATQLQTLQHPLRSANQISYKISVKYAIFLTLNCAYSFAKQATF